MAFLRLTALHIHAKNVFIVRIYLHESPPARYLPTVHIIAMMCTVHRIRKIMAQTSKNGPIYILQI